MTALKKIHQLDWNEIADSLNAKGYCLLGNILTTSFCDRLTKGYDEHQWYRKTVVMERYRFGQGEYRYFGYPLPFSLQNIRRAMYEGLAPIANSWMGRLKMEMEYPKDYNEFLALCHEKGQELPAVLILKYGQGGHNTLHQDLYGDVYFPIQIVLFLDEPEKDYAGGEFVLTQQVPRSQSKAMVLKPKKGDMLIFTTNFRPIKGSRGYYRANMRHGVSEVSKGERHTLGIIFHDALK